MSNKKTKKRVQAATVTASTPPQPPQPSFEAAPPIPDKLPLDTQVDSAIQRIVGKSMLQFEAARDHILGSNPGAIEIARFWTRAVQHGLASASSTLSEIIDEHQKALKAAKAAAYSKGFSEGKEQEHAKLIKHGSVESECNLPLPPPPPTISTVSTAVQTCTFWLPLGKDGLTFDEGYVHGTCDESVAWVSSGHDKRGGCKPKVSSPLPTAPTPITTPSTTPPSTATIATQTETPDAKHDDDAESFVTTQSTPGITWAEEMESVPIRSFMTNNATAPASSQPPPQSHSKAFMSLQQRARRIRYHTAKKSHNIHHPRFPHSMLPHRKVAQPLNPSSSPSSRVMFDAPSKHSSSWTENLFVLMDMAKALGKMGWIPPAQFGRVV